MQNGLICGRWRRTPSTMTHMGVFFSKLRALQLGGFVLGFRFNTIQRGVLYFENPPCETTS